MEDIRFFCSKKLKVEIVSHEMRMGCFTDSPIITMVANNRVLLDLSYKLWDLEKIKEKNQMLIMTLRKYPGTTTGIEVSIDTIGNLFLHGVKMEHDELMTKLQEYT